MWKTWSTENYSVVQRVEPLHRPSTASPKPRLGGSVIAHVGKGKTASKDPTQEWIENVYRIDRDLLGYNTGRSILLHCSYNDPSFNIYVGLPFTKGVTERGTGRTELILGSTAHHGEAMINQFDNVLWQPEDHSRYGNTMRWLNVGDTRTGFIGLDYNPRAAADAGVATSLDDIVFLANTLQEYGFDRQKRLFLLKPPYIQESEEGRRLRRSGKQTVGDYTR